MTDDERIPRGTDETGDDARETAGEGRRSEEQRDASTRTNAPGEPLTGTPREGGPTITGRSFAGASIASTQREQTADHRGESRVHRMDDSSGADES